jgi:hypothetical protein
MHQPTHPVSWRLTGAQWGFCLSRNTLMQSKGTFLCYPHNSIRTSHYCDQGSSLTQAPASSINDG